MKNERRLHFWLFFPFKTPFQTLKSQTPPPNFSAPFNLHTNIIHNKNQILNITELAITPTGDDRRLLFSSSVRTNHVEIIKHGHHRNRANEDQNRAKNPKEHGEGSVEEAVADGVENESFIKEIGDVIGGYGGGAGGNVDENIDLIDESDREGMAKEREEEESE